jgi:hypothetical protein
MKSTEVPKPVLSYESTAAAVSHLMEEDLASVPLILQQPLRERVKALASPASSQKIMVLPTLFYESFHKKRLSRKFLVSLGAANAWGWTAYGIYDDFLDAEARVSDLPLATTALRLCEKRLHESTSSNPDLAAYVQKILHAIEAANFWETTECRADPGQLKKADLPEYGSFEKLADRSFGHALGPLIIMARLGYAPASSKFESVTRFFKHYIIARQLHDDAHDWKEDLKAGRLTPVVCELVRDLKKQKHQEIEDVYWHHTAATVCDWTAEQLEKAENELKGLEELIDTRILDTLLSSVRSGVKITREQRQKTLEFLSSYQS